MSAQWWAGPDALLAGLPAVVWNEVNLLAITKSLGRTIGKYKAGALKDRGVMARDEADAHPLVALVDSLDAMHSESSRPQRIAKVQHH